MKQKIRELGILGAGLTIMGCIQYPSTLALGGLPLVPMIGLFGFVVMIVAIMTRKS